MAPHQKAEHRDGHAAEGDGEVCLSAIESSLKGEIQVILRKRKSLKWPRAETPTHYMTMGLDPDRFSLLKKPLR